MSEEAAGYGQMRPEDQASKRNAEVFQFDQLMARTWTSTPVLVTAVSGGGKESMPIVSVQPMVNQIDGQGFATAHGVISNIPAVRWQGGKNAIICDPKVGDKGMMMVASRDISAVKSSGAVANPGSERRYDPADGVYIGCFSADEPDQFVEFKSDGIKVVDKNGNIVETDADGTTLTDPSGSVIEMKSGGVTITPSGGTLAVNGSIAATGGISSNGGQHTLAAHVHSGVTPGPSNTGPPVTE